MGRFLSWVELVNSATVVGDQCLSKVMAIIKSDDYFQYSYIVSCCWRHEVLFFSMELSTSKLQWVAPFSVRDMILQKFGVGWLSINSQGTISPTITKFYLEHMQALISQNWVHLTFNSMQHAWLLIYSQRLGCGFRFSELEPQLQLHTCGLAQTRN